MPGCRGMSLVHMPPTTSVGTMSIMAPGDIPAFERRELARRTAARRVCRGREWPWTGESDHAHKAFACR